ncbi:MAG TPA: hypothetical protein VLM17_03610, partial [Xanthomonadaceae bacterium]|nr:hypothetical protein [Xanthomonadaceae bacterium]
MNTTRLAPLLLLALPFLGACERPHANAPANAPVAGSTGAPPETMLGKTVASAIEKARHELENGNIDLSHGIKVDVGDRGRHFEIGGNGHDGRAKAEITPQGDLLLDGKPVDVTPAQRALLLQYRQRIIAIAEAGMAVGVKGADLAGKALVETFSGLMHGDADAAGKRIEAEGEKLKADARRICAQLPGMLQAQQQLAASLPAFQPYATMDQHDVDDCMKDDRGVAVTDGGNAFGQQVQQTV